MPPLYRAKKGRERKRRKKGRVSVWMGGVTMELRGDLRIRDERRKMGPLRLPPGLPSSHTSPHLFCFILCLQRSPVYPHVLSRILLQVSPHPTTPFSPGRNLFVELAFALEKPLLALCNPLPKSPFPLPSPTPSADGQLSSVKNVPPSTIRCRTRPPTHPLPTWPSLRASRPLQG